MTISALPRDPERNIKPVTKEEFCPLCSLYIEGKCKDCPLVSIEYGTGCGHRYDGIKHAATYGSFIDTAFNLFRVVKDLLGRIQNEHVGDKQVD